MNRLFDEAPMFQAEGGDILVHLFAGPLDGGSVPTRPHASEMLWQGHCYRHCHLISAALGRETFVSEHHVMTTIPDMPD